MSTTDGSDRRPEGARRIEILLNFQEIHDQYFHFVWASLRGLGVPADGVDDAAQEVFIALHRRLSDFEGRSTLKTFLFGIVVGVARNHRRSLKRTDRLAPIEAATDAPDPGRSPFESAAASEALARLVSVLDRMEDAKREILILSEWEDLSAPEISDVLGVGVNTVYSRLRLARAEFERLLSVESRRSP